MAVALPASTDRAALRRRWGRTCRWRRRACGRPVDLDRSGGRLGAGSGPGRRRSCRCPRSRTPRPGRAAPPRRSAGRSRPVGRDTCDRRGIAELVDRHGDVDVLMGVDADDDLPVASSSAGMLVMAVDLLGNGRQLVGREGQDCDGSCSQQAPIRSLPSRPAGSSCRSAADQGRQINAKDTTVSRKQGSDPTGATPPASSQSKQSPTVPIEPSRPAARRRSRTAQRRVLARRGRSGPSV